MWPGAVVPQEVLLFNETVENNIRYGRIDATDKEIIEAAKAANAHEFIESFPKKYDQLVGERGIKLSTGQKQRIAIARAILRKPKILILDEATSSLDSESERLIQKTIKSLQKDFTIIIVTHKLSAVRFADKIYVLEEGNVCESGGYKELLEQKGKLFYFDSLQK